MGTFSSTANFIAQSSDPGALGAGSIWSDTDAGTTFRRTDANDAWEDIGQITGEIKVWAGTIALIPLGYVLCDDSAISRTTFSALFDVIGTQFGTGDGSTTFNVPDLRGKFPRGAPDSTEAGETGGADTVTLSGAESGTSAHNHAITDPGHFHGEGNNVPQLDTTLTGTESNTNLGGTITQKISSRVTGITIDNSTAANAASSHENRPAFQQTQYIIAT